MFDQLHEGQWWDKAWSLVDGCARCSPGCDHCYAEIMAARLAAMAAADVRAGRNPGRKARYGAVVTGARWNGTCKVWTFESQAALESALNALNALV